jgi:hypothetical protein
MRLFTFSGIAASITDINDGIELVEFASNVASALPADSRPSYDGRADVGHFRSFINYAVLLGDLERLVTLDGSPALNEEADELAPKYGQAILDQTSADPKETIMVLAHSQGTNLCAHTLIYIFNNQPAFFEERSIRCALFDPKVGANYMETIFGLVQLQGVSFLFFQSENDILGNQAFLLPKFIDEFPHGDHLWVRGLNHSEIRDWSRMNRPQGILTLPKYSDFRRDYRKEKLRLQQERGKPGFSTVEVSALQKFVKEYSMIKAKPSEALLGFLQGDLATKFQS